jgi:hypothetical protein
MRSVRVAILLLAALAVGVPACGRKGRASNGHAAAAVATPAPPTPDNTPIAALRTPAGWLLIRTEPPPATPTPTPAGSPAASPKP